MLVLALLGSLLSAGNTFYVLSNYFDGTQLLIKARPINETSVTIKAAQIKNAPVGFAPSVLQWDAANSRLFAIGKIGASIAIVTIDPSNAKVIGTIATFPGLTLGDGAVTWSPKSRAFYGSFFNATQLSQPVWVRYIPLTGELIQTPLDAPYVQLAVVL